MIAVQKHPFSPLRRGQWAAVTILALLAGLQAAPACAQTVVPKTRSSTETTSDPAASRSPGPAQPTANPDKSSARIPPDRPPEHAPGRLKEAPAQPAGPSVVSAIAVDASATLTSVSIALSRPAEMQVFTLADPYRLIIDAADVDFNVPTGALRTRGGLVQSLRYGLIAPGRSRIVIELTGPAKISDNRAAIAKTNGPVELKLTLVNTTPVEFAARLAPPAAPPQPAQTWQPAVKKEENGKPVIVIDPGHGGVDGGAVGAGNVLEKDLVLAVSRQLRQVLTQSGRYDVRMTRNGDTFLSLDSRVAFSRANEANLFISIHADSVADATVAKLAHGATVYTLSETASSRAAQRLADNENAADARAGLSPAALAEAEQVKSILTDLVQRETQNFSMKFRSLVVDRLGRERVLARDPARSAAFKVLRQDSTPAVLVELGFMTNDEEVQLMQTPAWQAKIARAIATAVDAYFDKRTPR